MSPARRHRRRIAVLAVAAALLGTVALGACTDELDRGTSRAATAPATSPEVVPPRPDVPDPGQQGPDLVVETDDELVGALRPCVRRFAEQHGVSAEVQAGDNSRAAIAQSLTSGTGPDVVTGSHAWIGALAEQEAIVPVPLPQGLRRHLEPVARAAVRYDGKSWGVPFGLDTTALVRNATLVPDAPRSFTEVVETGRRLTDAGRTEVPLVQEVGLNGDLRYAYPYLAASADGIFARLPDGGYDGTKLRITSSGWLRGGQRLAHLAEQGVLTTEVDARNSDALFDSGSSAWMVTGPWSLFRARQAGIPAEVSPLPPFADGSDPRPLVDVATLFVSAHSDRKRLSEQLVLGCGGSRRVQAGLARAGHRPPAMRTALDAAARALPEADLRAWARAAKRGDPVPNVPQMDGVWGPLAQAEADIVGGSSPATALREAAEAISRTGASPPG
ncbi:MAG TPA: extracellular solute-binding protein [Segeticoccus sp.]|nr:extracellular solute-binding protein [Segeticoccus sp.]